MRPRRVAELGGDEGEKTSDSPRGCPYVVPLLRTDSTFLRVCR